MRSKDLKHLGCGFGIGSLFASLFFVGWFLTTQLNVFASKSSFTAQAQPSPSATPVLPPEEATSTFVSTEAATTTPSPIITFTFTPTPPPIYTATLTESEMLIANGEIAITGPLSREQQIRLYESSLSFIAPTYKQSKEVAVQINQAQFSDPSTTCGPLSAAILQKAGILNENLIPHNFFLINPDVKKDRGILAQAFPSENYTDTRYKIRIDQNDWYSNPLMPGDFIYLYAGTGGNFEHMLIVNRVDSLGRAYSVTNYNTEQGFIIDEALLYDPSDPNTGLFSQWTEKQFAKLGSTGYAGYEVWRLKENQ
jgi:hypothetical protein